ncbi:MAG: tRNA (N6-threonylcarbamoyladenosine(37)-N6)-methyltransferase TrmO, partial [Thermodesulfobacteriota bacterium]
PIGRVQNDLEAPMHSAEESDMPKAERLRKVREDHEKIRETVSELVIFDQWAELLDGIEAFSHILILYWPHRLDPEKRKLRKVHPMGRQDLPEVGIFATCSPGRPNPVLVTTAPLLGRNGNILKVKALEALNGSPIIDVKPYVAPYVGATEPQVADWMRQLHEELDVKIF